MTDPWRPSYPVELRGPEAIEAALDPGEFFRGLYRTGAP